MSARHFKSERHMALGMAFPSEKTNRLYSVGFKPQPVKQPNALQRLMRKLFRVTEPTHRAAFYGDADMGL